MESIMKRRPVCRAIAKAALCAFGCTAALIAGTIPAFADTTAGSTTLHIQADGAQLSVTVPSELDFAAKSDGTLICPSNTQIRNNSVMAVHVSKIGVIAAAPANLAHMAALETTPDTISVQIAPGAGTPLEVVDYVTEAAPATGSQWNLARAGTQGDEIVLGLAGKINAFGSLDPATKTQFGTITWTVAPGTA
jgi:hypothetical protein